MRSTERPLQPFRGVLGDDTAPAAPFGESLVMPSRLWALTFMKKTASYRFRATIGTGVGRRRSACVLMLVRAVVTVPVLKMEERSEAEVVVEMTDARLDAEDGGFHARAGGGGATRRIEPGWEPPGCMGRGDAGSGGTTVVEGETSGGSVGGVTVSLLEGSLGGSGLATGVSAKSFSQS